MILQMRDVGFNVFFWILIVFIIIGAIALQIYILIWVYKDAKKRNMDGAVWLLIVFITGIIGLIIYLIIRNPMPSETSEPPAEVKQPQIEEEIPKERATKYCAMCGEKIPIDVQFCSYCGSKVSE
jgi:hypothetical protein